MMTILDVECLDKHNPEEECNGWQTDIIIEITNNGVHHWKRNDDKGIDLYYK